MSENRTTTVPVTTERLAHLEALAVLMHRFIEEARAIDARYNPDYAAMARELRALGFAVREDVPTDLEWLADVCRRCGLDRPGPAHPDRPPRAAAGT